MRPYVLPFALGITVGMIFAFLVTAFPDSWVLEQSGFGAWKVPQFLEKVPRHASSGTEGLMSMAVLLRYAAFMMENGYWFLAVPTIITCGYTKLNIISQNSPKWASMFDAFNSMTKLATAGAIFFSLFAVWIYTGNVAEQLTMMVILVAIELAVFWLCMSVPMTVLLAMNLTPLVCDFWSSRKIHALALVGDTNPSQ